MKTDMASKEKEGLIAYEDIENMFKSWMGNFYKIMSKKQRENMLALYEELFDKHIEIQHKKMIFTDRRAIV